MSWSLSELIITLGVTRTQGEMTNGHINEQEHVGFCVGSLELGISENSGDKKEMQPSSGRHRGIVG